MTNKSTSNWVLIVVAIIGMVGTITAAFIHCMGLIITNPINTPDIQKTESENKIDLSGVWYMQTTTEETTYNPFKGIVIRYKLFLTHDTHKDRSIIVNGNKISEIFHGTEHEYTGVAKTPINLTGSLIQDESGQMIIKLNGQENGLLRKSIATSFELKLLNSSQMIGTFSSNAANSKGTTFWVREDELHKTKLGKL